MMRPASISDARHEIPRASANRARWRLLLAWVILLGAGSGARAATVAALEPEQADLSSFPQDIRGTWLQDAGRQGGPALAVDGRGAQGRFSLFNAPKHLPVPDRYRAEVWLRAEGAGCQFDVVLFDSQGREHARRTIISYPTVSSLGNRDFWTRGSLARAWSYGACDISVEEPVEGLLCNVEVVINDACVYIDTLKVSSSESILPNGDFQFLDPPPNAEKQNNTPRGWRRSISPNDGTPQADGGFFVEELQRGRFLTVTKGEGAYLISATPVVIPDEAESVAARAYVEASDLRARKASARLPLPGIVLRQYGTKGLLKEDFSQAPVVQTGRTGETLVSTGRLRAVPGGNRVLLALSFPRQAGTWRVRAVELVPLGDRTPSIRIHTDQVGYDAGRPRARKASARPLRFMVSSSVFPPDGAGRFVLKNQQEVAYQGSLVSLGRAAGAHGRDWGSYYFEGVVNDIVPGSYVLEAYLAGMQATGRPVRVGPRLLVEETGELAYRFYSIQRCGCEVPGWHGPCHMDDAKLPDGSHVDATGGYHNAGDMHKHMGDNTPVSVYGMVCAYESDPVFFDRLDRDGNGRADILDEAVWGADWMRKMADPSTGRLRMNVTNDIDYYGIPEHDTDGIPGNGDDRVINTNDPSDWGGYAIAAWAVLARRLDAPLYLEAARKAWAVYEDRILAAYEPRQVFAAIELYRSTREAEYLAMAEGIAGKLLELQNTAGWFARTPGGPPEQKIVDEGVIPAALARFVLEVPASSIVPRVRESLRAYFAWVLRMADNPFGLLRNYTGAEPFYFKARDDWFGGSNSAYLSTAWAAYLAAAAFTDARKPCAHVDEPELAGRLLDFAANQVHWILGMNPLDLCMFEGKGTSGRIYYHHLYAEIPGHERGAVPGAIPNGIVRPPDNSDRPWFDLRTGPGSLPGAESAEPWLPHNAYYLLVLSAAGR